MIAKTLHRSNKRSKELDQKPFHTILVIDEVDNFSSSEKSFTLLIEQILRSKQYSHTNISVIGIANSVDLPFKKKHSAIAMRDC